MALSSAARYLSSLTKYGIRPSLERIRDVLEALGRPERHYSVVLITGTNGKGTCAKALSEILRAHGVRVGLYTSPHLFSYAERYEIDGKKISDEDFEREVTDQRAMLAALSARLTEGNPRGTRPKGGSGITEFEFLTLMAYRLFSKRQVSWAVVEIGMGGRWDATNVADPRLAVITSVGIDHTEFLGKTKGQIAFDKAHVARKNRDILVGPVTREAREAIEKVSRAIGARPVFLSSRDVRPTWKSHLPARIFGAAFALAVLAARKILGPRFRMGRAGAAIRRSALPGRYEIKKFHGREILFDVAHNEQALDGLFGQIRGDFPKRRLSVLIGMQRQKRGEEKILRHLVPGDSVRIIKLSTSRSKPPSMWKPFVRRAQRLGVRMFPPSRMRPAFEEAVTSSHVEDILVVTGSFYTVREAWGLCK